MIMVGVMGFGPKKHPSEMTPQEQVTQMSLYAVGPMPILLSCDLTKLDPLSKSILTNDEVLAMNQDAVTKCATSRWEKDGLQIWARTLSDGSLGIAAVNATDIVQEIPVDLAKIGWTGGPAIIRNVWKKRDMSSKNNKVVLKVSPHGSYLLRASARK
jgi:alpha-galactosidase